MYSVITLPSQVVFFTGTYEKCKDYLRKLSAKKRKDLDIIDNTTGRLTSWIL